MCALFHVLGIHMSMYLPLLNLSIHPLRIPAVKTCDSECGCYAGCSATCKWAQGNYFFKCSTRVGGACQDPRSLHISKKYIQRCSLGSVKMGKITKQSMLPHKGVFWGFFQNAMASFDLFVGPSDVVETIITTILGPFLHLRRALQLHGKSCMSRANLKSYSPKRVSTLPSPIPTPVSP